MVINAARWGFDGLDDVQRSYFYTAVFSSSSMHPQHHIPAKELYHKAKSVGVLHDVISYNAMISALGKAPLPPQT